MLTLLDIERVLTFYALGTLYGVTQASRGFVNETAFIQTSSGRYVVRRNHRRLGKAAQLYRHELINHLCEQDFPTPALIPTRDGETLLELEGRFFEIMTYVEGEDFDPNRPQQRTSVGATLARYHQAVQDFPPPPFGDQSQQRYSSLNIMALIENLLMRDVMGELYVPLMWYSKRASELRSAFSEAAYARLPHLIIHGDIHRDNLLFAGDDVIALLDYDQIAWDARIVDIADALIAFATSSDSGNQLMWGVFRGPLDVAHTEALIGGYTAVAPLTTIEIRMLPVLIELLWLQGELGRVMSTPDGAPDYHQSVLDQGRWLSEWMGEHGDLLVNRWLELREHAPQAEHAPAIAA